MCIRDRECGTDRKCTAEIDSDILEETGKNAPPEGGAFFAIYGKKNARVRKYLDKKTDMIVVKEQNLVKGEK